MTKEEYMQRIIDDVCNQNGCVTQMVRSGIYLLLLILFLSSCATKTIVEYRDRDVIRYVTKIQHDTLIDKTTDSVFVNVYTKGDTVFSEKYKEKTKWRERIVEKHDTCWKDSIVTVKKEITTEVVKIPKIYQYSLFFSIICCIFALIKLLRWLRIL